MQHSWHIPRRTFLRGAGAAIALPWLDAMQAPTAHAAAASAGPPVRLAAMSFPNGMYRKNWIPEKAGADFDLPMSLSPLESVRSEVLVLSGLDKAASHGGDGHYAKDGNFLTGMPVAKTTGKDISVGGVSLDQLAAQRIGRQTPLASIELGTQPTVSGVDANVGMTRLYGSYISWRTAHVPVAKEIDPRVAYERLFGPKDGGGLPTRDARRREDAVSLLDFALDDARRLRGRLGRDDQFKLDEYMDSIRNVEQRLAFHAQPDARRWRPVNVPNHPDEPEPSVPPDHAERVRLMLDLIYLAFWTDTTRIATFMFANSVANTNFSQVIEGVTGGHHELSHHQNNPSSIEQYSKIARWHVEQFAYLLEKMRKTPEGDGTLLDHSAILLGSGMSDGNEHNPDNLPILVGGRAGGQIAPGRHLANPKGTPLCNLYLSLLNCVGVAVDHFGDSKEALKLT
jgi:hypothetical protein